MAKVKDRSEVEMLRGLVKALTAQNKTLKQRLGRIEKKRHKVEELDELFIEMQDEVPLVPNNKCGECQNGSLKDVEIGANRILTSCDSCDYKKSRKK